jgi:putative NADH-flavin reductase
MQITVFGASGKVGTLVVEEALRRGFTVTAFIHRRNLFAPSGNLAIVQGDIYNSTDVAKALRGSQAVVSCLGSWGTPKKNVLASAVQAIIPAMHEHKIQRIITLTGSSALEPGASPQLTHRLLLRLLAPFPAGKVFYDGEEHMRLLAQSGLDWTTVRSPVMNNIGKAYTLNLRPANPWETITRTSVAKALLDQIQSSDFRAAAPVIHRK